MPIGGGDLAEVGQQTPRGDRANAGHRLQHGGAVAQGRVRLHHAVELTIHRGELVFDEREHGADTGVQERRAFLDLLRMANTMANPKEIARQLVAVAQHLSGCEAVAIRLKNGPGYPYVASLGFPEPFLFLEDDLCARDEAGHLLRSDQRQPILACLCGRVLSGQVDSLVPTGQVRRVLAKPGGITSLIDAVRACLQT